MKVGTALTVKAVAGLLIILAAQPAAALDPRYGATVSFENYGLVRVTVGMAPEKLLRKVCVIVPSHAVSQA